MPLKTVRVLTLVLCAQISVMTAVQPALTQTEEIPPVPTDSPLPATVADGLAPNPPEITAPYFTWGGRRTYVGVDFKFVSAARRATTT